MSLIVFSEHMTENPGHQNVGRTHLGQAHLAGTGPEGATCGQCCHWYSVDSKGRPFHPYRSMADGVMHLEPARCRYPIANKANRRVPPTALACRFFEPSDKELPLTRARKRRPQ